MSRVPLRNALYIARRDTRPEPPPVLAPVPEAAPETYLTVHHPPPLPMAPPEPQAPSAAPEVPSRAPQASAEVQVDARLLEEMRRLNEPLLQAVTALTEALYAEQEVVKDENRRIIGMRRKRPVAPGSEPDIEISN